MQSRVQFLYNTAAAEIHSATGVVRALASSARQKFVTPCETLALAGVRNLSKLWAPLKRLVVPAGVLGYSGQAMAADLSTQVSSWAADHQAGLLFGGVLLGEFATVSALIALWKRQINAAEAHSKVEPERTLSMGQRDFSFGVLPVDGSAMGHSEYSWDFPQSLEDLRAKRIDGFVAPSVLQDVLRHTDRDFLLMTAFEELYNTDPERAVSEAVLRAKSTRDVYLGEVAVKLVAEREGQNCLEALTMLAHQANLVPVRCEALRKIYLLTGEAGQDVYQRLCWGGTDVALDAVSFLARKRDGETILELQRISKLHSNQFVRDQARYMMAKYFGRVAMPFLAEQILSQHMSYIDKLDAIFAFSEINDPEVLKTLGRLFEASRGHLNLGTAIACELAFARVRLERRQDDVVARPWSSGYVMQAGVTEEQ